MDTPLANEKQLLADIERLREQFPQTQELYREVCILLFFRYGMAPTANKLYQLVRKGSMSAPAEALNKFWEDLREKSRVRIEHPDLPEALKTAAGELTATLWTSAQALANESLASYRSEAQVMVAEARASAEVAGAERDAALQAQEKSQEELNSARVSIGALTHELAAVTATNLSLESQFNQARNDGIAQQQRLADARLDFTSELEKLRLAGQLADERFRACETRALLEIDRERGTCAKLQKELDTTRTAATQSEERMRSEIGTLQGQLGDLRQSVGTLEGKPKLRLACRQSGACQLMSNLSACGGTTPRSRRRTKFQKNWPFTFCGSRNEAPVHRVNFRSAATPITSSSAANRSKVCRYELSNKCPVAVTGKSYREIPAS